MSQDSPAIGIDLGTTNCCVGFLTSNNQVDIIDNEFGDRTTPSYVAFTDPGEIVGKLAKESVFRTPENVIYDSKRLIGRKFDDKYLQPNLKLWPFKVICDTENDTPLIQISRNGNICKYKPHEISAKLLAYMKEAAEKRLGKKVKNAVITVPAYFNYHQRTATKEAGALAGLNVLKIINEPTAAALAYIHKNEINDCENLLVVDIGGGTLDVSVVSVQAKSVTVRATCGNTHLGGRDFDNNLTNFIVSKLKEQFQIDVENRKVTMQRIKARSEKLKIKLSCQHKTFFELISVDDNDVNLEISRNDFEKVNCQLFNWCIQTVENCFSHGGIQKTDINKLLLIGGSSRIPKLQQMLKELFNGKAELINAINPDEAVAYGAAIQATMFGKGDQFELVHIDDVTPLSLGTYVNGGKMSILVARNSKIPVTRTATFHTSVNNQKSMLFSIYEGERTVAQYNTGIGKCTAPLPPRPVGYSLDLLFRIDTNGILEVELKLDTRVYNKLAIEYEKHAVQKVNDILQDAVENKAADEKTTDAISKWLDLHRYCQRMKSICFYKTRDISDKERDIIDAIAEGISIWVDENEVVDGSLEETNAILEKQTEIEDICEPILKKYEYEVENMTIKEFYNFVSES